MANIKGKLRPEGINNYADVIHLETTASQVIEEANKRFMTDAERTKLAGIATGAQVNPTASQILTSLKTVDGSGSGLDADTLDGKHANDFALAIPVRVRGIASYTDVIPANGTLVKNIPIGSGKIEGRAVISNTNSGIIRYPRGVLVTFTTDIQNTKVVGYNNSGGGAGSYALNNYVTGTNNGDGFIGGEVIGTTASGVQTKSMYIKGSNIEITFVNTLSSPQTLETYIDWEVR